MTSSLPLPSDSARTESYWRVPSSETIGRIAAEALRTEANLTPKPGLVDRRGGGAHDDMKLADLIASAAVLATPITECARAAAALPLGRELRAEIGVIGRAGEALMLQTTAGVNTHRGALWAIGLLAAGYAATGGGIESAAAFGAALAGIEDPRSPGSALTHGARARLRFGAAGAKGEALSGFPHTTRIALPMLRRRRDTTGCETTAHLDALLASMATLEDTCLLHRGGPRGLTIVRRGAADILAAGGSATHRGRLLFEHLDRQCVRHRLSPGGSGDVLAAAIFADAVDTYLYSGERTRCEL